MKKTSVTIILFLALLASISKTHAQSGPLPMQEVEATGQGANADDAFKQAVNDAVRQVVGTLVSAENVINNERVIKDQVLTLSDGFVEKVLSQDKTKLDDGTWQVKLKCIVRKGQLYGRLQEAKVPTVKFEGVSLFADSVSRTQFRQDANNILAKAVRNFLRQYPSCIKFDCEKPEIVHAGDVTTRVKIKFTPKLDTDRYFNQVLPPLRDALKQVSKDHITVESAFLTKHTALYQSEGSQKIREVMLQERDGWSVYAIEKEIVDGCDIGHAFNGDLVTVGQSLILFQNDSNSVVQIAKSPCEAGYIAGDIGGAAGGRVVAKVSKYPSNFSDGHFETEVEISTTLLPNITKITMRLGLNVFQFLDERNGSEYNGFFENSPKRLFCSEGWFVYAPDEYDIGKLSIVNGLSAGVKHAAMTKGILYYLGDSLE